MGVAGNEMEVGRCCVKSCRVCVFLFFSLFLLLHFTFLSDSLLLSVRVSLS